MVIFSQLWSIMVILLDFSCFFPVTFSVFLVNFWSIICQLLGIFLQFFLNFSIRCFVNSIIYSIIVESQLSSQLFSQLLQWLGRARF